MFTAKREMFRDVLEEVKPILDEHWRELARNQDKIRLNPAYEKYLALETAGIFRAYIVRAEDSEIAGYAAFMVLPHLHYKDHIWALSDLFFVRPKFRASRKLTLFKDGAKPKGAGRTLFEAVENDLRKAGVSVIHATWKLANPAAGAMLKKMGYSPIEGGAAKILKD